MSKEPRPPRLSFPLWAVADVSAIERGILPAGLHVLQPPVVEAPEVLLFTNLELAERYASAHATGAVRPVVIDSPAMLTEWLSALEKSGVPFARYNVTGSGRVEWTVDIETLLDEIGE
jgi:hypothetical protein